MDVFHTIATHIERLTGYPCVPMQASIEDRHIMITIETIERLERPHHYGVHGTFTLQSNRMQGWSVLTTLLQLSLTGSRAQLRCASREGFSLTCLDFFIIVQDDHGQISLVQSVDRLTTLPGESYVH